jgi:hypothetical protein
MPFSSQKKDPLAREIVAMLIRRKRAARRAWLRTTRAGVSQEFVNLLDAHYCEAHNAAEAARRLLYAAAAAPSVPVSSG